MGVSLGKLIQDIMSLIGDVIQSSSYMHTHSQEALKASVFARWFTNLSWHIAGFVTKLIAKFQNANSSPEIAKYHICQLFLQLGQPM